MSFLKAGVPVPGTQTPVFYLLLREIHVALQFIVFGAKNFHASLPPVLSTCLYESVALDDLIRRPTPAPSAPPLGRDDASCFSSSTFTVGTIGTLRMAFASTTHIDHCQCQLPKPLQGSLGHALKRTPPRSCPCLCLNYVSSVWHCSDSL